MAELITLTDIKLGDIVIDVVLKKVKNIRLSVHPPTGRVRISASSHMSMESIRVFALSKLDWIKNHQKNIRAQDRVTRRDFVDRESHYLWGKRYLMQVIEGHVMPSISIKGKYMVLWVRPDTGRDKRQAVVEAWYRGLVKAAALELIAKWEPLMKVTVDKVYVRRMKTRWGSCTPQRRSIRLNTEFAKKPQECLEYIVVHEMVHLLEPTHNKRFVALMDRFLPNWKHIRSQLNQLPVREESWLY